jgi:hypothetical protein
MNNITIDKNRLYINESFIYEFESEIQETLQSDSSIFVLIRNKTNEIYNRNLFCFNNEGQLVWRNEDFFKSLEKPDYAHYVYIWFKDEGLWGKNYFGTYDHKIDMDTGKIIESHHMK